jgi:hypothetical protein
LALRHAANACCSVALKVAMNAASDALAVSAASVSARQRTAMLSARTGEKLKFVLLARLRI